jgi:hypothetical protein
MPLQLTTPLRIRGHLECRSDLAALLIEASDLLFLATMNALRAATVVAPNSCGRS